MPSFLTTAGAFENTSDLEDALVGGFITYLKDKDLVSPEEIVPLTFDCFLKFTPADWISYLNMDDIFQTGSSLSSSLDQEVASQISRYFRYQIVSSSIDGNHATVIVTVTSLNLKSILEDYRQKLLSYASTTEAIRATDQELAEKTAQLLLTSLKANDATFSQNIEVHLVNNGFSWSVQLSDDALPTQYLEILPKPQPPLLVKRKPKFKPKSPFRFSRSGLFLNLFFILLLSLLLFLLSAGAFTSRSSSFNCFSSTRPPVRRTSGRKHLLPWGMQ